MRYRWVVACVVLIALCGGLFAEDQGVITFGASRDHVFPEVVAAYLDGYIPGWSLTPVNRDAERMFREQNWRGQPNWHWADLNGDGKTDYVVSLRHAGKGGPLETELALLAQGAGFAAHRIASRPASENRSLYLVRYVPPEEELLDTAGHSIQHANGALELIQYEKDAVAYFFARKKFSSRRTR